MSSKSRVIAREMISQQDPEFGNKLTSLWEEILSCNTSKEAQDHPAREKIVKMIKDRIGLKIDLQVDTSIPPACMPAMANPNHILSTIKMKGLYGDETTKFEEAVSKAEKKIGTIDLKNAKVGGIYSEIESPVWMSFYFCKREFSARECAAVFTHEIGHCFLAYEFMFRSLRASQILAALHHVRTGRDDSVSYVHAIEMAGETLTKDKKEFVDCVSLQNELAISSIVFGRVFNKMKSDFNDNSVAAPNFEVLADNFSSKWGFAKELTTALFKLYGPLAIQRSNRLVETFLYMKPIFGFVFLTIAAAGGYSSIVNAAIALVVLTLKSGRGDSSVNIFQQSNVYDKPTVRLQRIRETVIERMKRFKLSIQDRKALDDEIKTIDELLKNSIERSNIADDLSNLVFTSDRRAELAFRLERNMEQLTNNDLFASANKLKTI